MRLPIIRKRKSSFVPNGQTCQLFCPEDTFGPTPTCGPVLFLLLDTTNISTKFTTSAHICLWIQNHWCVLLSYPMIYSNTVNCQLQPVYHWSIPPMYLVENEGTEIRAHVLMYQHMPPPTVTEVVWYCYSPVGVHITLTHYLW